MKLSKYIISIIEFLRINIMEQDFQKKFPKHIYALQNNVFGNAFFLARQQWWWRKQKSATALNT